MSLARAGVTVYFANVAPRVSDGASALYGIRAHALTPALLGPDGAGVSAYLGGVVDVATSRTGTAQYKHWRKRVLIAARDAGIAQCPHCGVRLDYTRGLQPNSAEPDHILPVRWGGKNTLENGRVLCRRCNQSRGDGTRPKVKPRRAASVDVDW